MIYAFTVSWPEKRSTAGLVRKHLKVRPLAASLIFLLAVGTACAGGLPSVVSGRIVLASRSVHPGTSEKIAVVAHVEPGYHINDHKPSLDYLIPTKVEFEHSPSLRVENVVYPRGTLRKFAFLDSPISVYEGEIRLRAVLKVNQSVKPGTYPLKGKLMYQACNDHACLPPTNALLEVSVRVVPSATH